MREETMRKDESCDTWEKVLRIVGLIAVLILGVWALLSAAVVFLAGLDTVMILTADGKWYVQWYVQ